ncbi:FtsQ-type POTRA domain-containing protein [Chitinispirillales bacterium ANBcel5]|uniref:cell division protein FtsQ/DivIB n=1 Tax=Cellulosispirillum alkaliphilum TaxID=3039283 RepID=UPI002A504CB4|nr:FtsQ-type POTRA domain-containing protein [Chitinispirillales bacterium ANBcel5]
MGKRVGANYRKNQKKKEEIRKKRKKLFFRLFLLIAIIIPFLWFTFKGARRGIQYAIEAIDESDLLDVTSIRVYGTNKEIENDIMTHIDTLLTDKIYNISTRDIRDALLTLPGVEHVRVRRGIDGVLSITITRRKPVAMIPLNKMVLMDRDGFIFPTSKGEFYEVPVLSGIAEYIDSNRVRENYLEQVLKFIDSAHEIGENFYKQMATINIGKQGELTFNFQGSGIQYIATIKDIQSQLNKAAKMRKLLSSANQTPSVVNLSFQHMAFVRMENRD